MWIFYFFLFSLNLFASVNNYSTFNKLKYKTFFGNCPSKVAGDFAFILMKKFEEKPSLYDLKKFIADKKVDAKYFIEDYHINFDPIDNSLKFQLDCPKPLLKANLLNEKNKLSYSAIMTHKGDLVDPSYEVFLQAEQKLNFDLPILTMKFDQGSNRDHEDLALYFSQMDKMVYQNLAEAVLTNQNEMLLILSFDHSPVRVFLGDKNWADKTAKLSRMINYFKVKKKYPSTINLTQSKKIVVKFSDSP